MSEDTLNKDAKDALEKVIELIKIRLDYLIACHEGNDGEKAMSLVKTDELIKIAKLLKEMDEEEKIQGDGDAYEADEIRFVLDKQVKKLAK